MEEQKPLGADLRAIRESYSITVQGMADVGGISFLTQRVWEAMPPEKQKEFDPKDPDTYGRETALLKKLWEERQQAISIVLGRAEMQAKKRGGKPECVTVQLPYYRSQKEYDAAASDGRAVAIANADSRVIGDAARYAGYRVQYHYPDDGVETWI